MDFPFKTALGGYFEFPTDNARRLLPAHLEPVELHHGSSIFSVTIFDTPESPLGPHRKVIYSVVVVPLVRGDAVPKVAMFPYRIGATQAAARQAAAEMFHVPHWDDDVQVDLVESGSTITARVTAGRDPIVDLTVSEYTWQPVSHDYQWFTKDASAAYVAGVRVAGAMSEHEDETGKLTLYDHPFNAGLVITDVYDVPFREIWLRNGVQTFEAPAVLTSA